MRIINVGLPKTGTTSLARALNQLGIRTAHGPRDICFAPEQEQKELLRRFEGLCEIIGMFDIDKLISWFPDATLVCTRRPYVEWISSCERHFTPSPCEGVRRIRLKRFGVQKFHRETFDRLFGRHQQYVKKLVQSGKPIRDLYITAGDGYPELCSHLKIDIPKAKFPHARKSKRSLSKWIFGFR